MWQQEALLYLFLSTPLMGRGSLGRWVVLATHWVEKRDRRFRLSLYESPPRILVSRNTENGCAVGGSQPVTSGAARAICSATIPVTALVEEVVDFARSYRASGARGRPEAADAPLAPTMQ